MYLVLTKHFYKDVENNSWFLEKLDTSNFPTNHPCYRTIRKKEPGRFTDETGSVSILEHVALRAKAYAFNMGGEETLKAKGIAKTTVLKHMKLEDYKNCLFGITGNNYTPNRRMTTFRSYNHEVYTISSEKLTLNRGDDKRFVMPDQIHTLAHGHYLSH